MGSLSLLQGILLLLLLLLLSCFSRVRLYVTPKGSPSGSPIPGIFQARILEWIPFLLQRRASLVAQMVKNPPAMQDIQVPSLGQEDLLEKGMATHSTILA